MSTARRNIPRALERGINACPAEVCCSTAKFSRGSSMSTNNVVRIGFLALALAIGRDATPATMQSVHEIQITASKFKYEPNTIQVTAGETVRLVLRSKDSVHGFSIPKLKVTTTIPKGGDAVTVEFIAPAPGQYEIACDEFC